MPSPFLRISKSQFNLERLLTSALCSNTDFSSIDSWNRLNSGALGGEVLRWEVTKGGVLGAWEQFVHAEFPSLAVGLCEYFLEMVLNNHAGGKVDFGHAHMLVVVTHLYLVFKLYN